MPGTLQPHSPLTSNHGTHLWNFISVLRVQTLISEGQAEGCSCLPRLRCEQSTGHDLTALKKSEARCRHSSSTAERKARASTPSGCMGYRPASMQNGRTQSNQGIQKSNIKVSESARLQGRTGTLALRGISSQMCRCPKLRDCEKETGTHSHHKAFQVECIGVRNCEIARQVMRRTCVPGDCRCLSSCSSV